MKPQIAIPLLMMIVPDDPRTTLRTTRANVLAEHMGREAAPAPLVFNWSSPFSQSSASARRADGEPQLASSSSPPAGVFMCFEMAMAMTRLR
jgi:hypothetical protein